MFNGEYKAVENHVHLLAYQSSNPLFGGKNEKICKQQNDEANLIYNLGDIHLTLNNQSKFFINIFQNG